MSNLPEDAVVGPVICVDGQCYGEHSVRLLLAELSQAQDFITKFAHSVGFARTVDGIGKRLRPGIGRAILEYSHLRNEKLNACQRNADQDASK